ncbi:MAG TPA: aminopeptidase P family protein [Firmicutes bacterium]|nr:aminopeptidase P family protein [Bacillota bacterium]HHY97131.1 aminopeptidase P family protein [Bacillota bacterium]
MDSRLKRFRALLKEQSLDAYIVLKPENRRYLSGFTGSSGILVIGHEDAALVTDFRYMTQAKEELRPGFRVEKHEKEIAPAIAGVVKGLGAKTVGFESDYLTWNLHEKLASELGAEIQLLPREGLVESLRIVKDQSEIERISRAARLGDEAFSHILGFMRPGMSEIDVALELEWFMRKNGADKMGFDVIVASGHRGALPHGKPSTKKLVPGDLVVMDFGAMMDGYCADMTRTVGIGKIDARAKEIYDIVRKAQQAGLDALKAGLTGQEADQASRKVIIEAGYGDYFGHALGHGVGLAVHELPRLSESYPVALPEGTVVTVEPGIYIPDWVGVRIEDLVVVHGDGPEILTHSTKDLIEIG